MKLNFYAILGGILLLSCTQKTFAPLPSANPWADDYTNVSAMKLYKKWGTYNVHDPSCKLIGDTYYMYSTDAIFNDNRQDIKNENLPFGYIQVRKSTDLVNWQFIGWAFNEIPHEAKAWVLEHSGGKGASNIWAPYIHEHHGKFRLYYSVSAFGMQTSYIGLAESASPEGPWDMKGCVVKTKTGDVMNAIDPSIVVNPQNGEQWMHYGSYFGGLHCVQLDPQTGLTLKKDDQGHLTARRFDGKKNNIEAPEIMYDPQTKHYFLFVSYDPLMTTYNIRVGRSDKPQGPFVDFFGTDMRDESENFPILTYPYQFDNHQGWAGMGHCGLFADKNGKWYLAHQGRLQPENHLMDLHIRSVAWTKSGWPVLSPERYAATEQQQITKNDLAGNWEIITIKGHIPQRELEAGQVLWGENHLKAMEQNKSVTIVLDRNASINGAMNGTWSYDENQGLTLSDSIQNLHVFMGHDWENETQTILFTGLDANGYSIWGKKIK